ncbi:hypothetical protein RP20_CCG004511 [Aedes albopictus]|nr:hypothetical protein RP20_CCG004511 [Aedes albopictus]
MVKARDFHAEDLGSNLTPDKLTKYKPNHVGQCVISSVGPGQRSFCMVDRDHPDGTKLFAAMQSMSCARIFQLPPPGEIFGIFLEDSVFRAVRNKPTAHSPSRKNYIRLVDTGEILPYDSALPMCTLSEYYRRIPAFAIRCVLVSVVSDPFCQDFDRFLKKMLGTSLHFKVISTSSSGRKSLFVELSQHPIVVRDKPSSTTSSPESTPPNKGKSIFGRRNRSGPLFSPSPPKPPRADIFAVDSAEQNNPFTSIRFPSVSIGEKRTGESNCTSKNGLNAGKVGGEKTMRIVPPIGSHVMLVPKFIRDVGHMWCHVVKADYVNPDFREMELRMNDPEYAMRYRKLQGRPQMSQRVFAKYVDKRWYRAEVIRYFDERNVLVFYVDYGNSEMVSLGEVHEWDETFGYLPYQAVLCKLSNLKPAKRFHVQAVVELNRTLLNKRVEAQIVDNSNPWEVTIYDQDGFDVSCGLVIAGLAKRIKEDDEQEAGQEAPAG